MKKVTNLLLATSAILLSNIAYASDVEPCGSKRSRAALEASEALEGSNTPLYQPNGSVETTEESNKKRRSSKGKKKGKTRASSQEESSSLTHLPEEVTALYTRFLDIQSLVNLASASKPLRHLLLEIHPLDAMRAFIINDPFLPEKEGFELWKEIYDVFGSSMEDTYNRRYHAQLIEQDGNTIDYNRIRDINNLSLFFYAQGLIRSKLKRISQILRLPQSSESELDLEIKKRALDIFGYLNHAESKPKLNQLAFNMGNNITASVVVKNSDTDTTYEAYTGAIYEILQKTEEATDLPYRSDFTCTAEDYTDIEDAAHEFDRFEKAAQSSDAEKESHVLQIFASSPAGAHYKRISDNNPTLKKLTHNGANKLTYQQQEKWRQDVDKFATKIAIKMLRENLRAQERSRKAQSFWGNLHSRQD